MSERTPPAKEPRPSPPESDLAVHTVCTPLEKYDCGSSYWQLYPDNLCGRHWKGILQRTTILCRCKHVRDTDSTSRVTHTQKHSLCSMWDSFQSSSILNGLKTTCSSVVLYPFTEWVLCRTPNRLHKKLDAVRKRHFGVKRSPLEQSMLVYSVAVMQLTKSMFLNCSPRLQLVISNGY